MLRIPLQALPAFRAVAERQNLRLAAQALHLTHGAVSQQIKGLEAQLGFALFERRGRGLVLNAAGQTLLQHVSQALDMVDVGVQSARLQSNHLQQHLRISSVPSLARRWLLPRIGALRQAQPGMTLTVETTETAVDLLRDGYHAAIRYGTGNWPGLVAERLTSKATMQRIMLGNAAAATRLAGATPADIAKEALLGERALWQQWFAQAGHPMDITPVAVFNDDSLQLQAAEMGLGLAITRHILAHDALKSGALHQITPLTVDWKPDRDYYLVYPPTLRDWAPLQILRDWLLAQLTEVQQHAP